MNESQLGPMRWGAILVACLGFYLYLFSETQISLGLFLLIQLLAGFLFTRSGTKASSTEEHKTAKPARKRRARSARNTRRNKKAAKKSARQVMAQHTRQAVQNAGRNPEESPVRLVDIGLFVYFEDVREPRVFRELDIPDNAVAIQPFAIFHLDEKAYGPICFEIYNSAMDLRFREEQEQQLEVGNNYIFTRNYLSQLAEFSREDRWSLQLHAGEHTIAIHYFDWFEAPDFKMAADGEINTGDLRDFMEAEMPEEISLEQLIRT